MLDPVVQRHMKKKTCVKNSCLVLLIESKAHSQSGIDQLAANQVFAVTVGKEIWFTELSHESKNVSVYWLMLVFLYSSVFQYSGRDSSGTRYVLPSLSPSVRPTEAIRLLTFCDSPGRHL